MLFHRVLVPLDFTEKNLRALEIARQIAVQNKASVALLHVIETVEHVPFDELKGFYAQLEATARDRFRLASTMMLEKGLVVEPEVVYGKRAEEIVKYAAANGVDLIVLSSHKIDVEQPVQGWATISYKLENRFGRTSSDTSAEPCEKMGTQDSALEISNDQLLTLIWFPQTISVETTASEELGGNGSNTFVVVNCILSCFLEDDSVQFWKLREPLSAPIHNLRCDIAAKKLIRPACN